MFPWRNKRASDEASPVAANRVRLDVSTKVQLYHVKFISNEKVSKEKFVHSFALYRFGQQTQKLCCTFDKCVTSISRISTDTISELLEISFSIGIVRISALPRWLSNQSAIE